MTLRRDTFRGLAVVAHCTHYKINVDHCTGVIEPRPLLLLVVPQDGSYYYRPDVLFFFAAGSTSSLGIRAGVSSTAKGSVSKASRESGLRVLDDPPLGRHHPRRRSYYVSIGSGGSASRLRSGASGVLLQLGDTSAWHYTRTRPVIYISGVCRHVRLVFSFLSFFVHILFEV